MRPLRIGVVGAGHMGRRHAQKVAALRDAGLPVTLAGIADPDVERARSVASEHRTRAVADAGELYRDVDATIVAVPTVHHFEITRSAIAAGLDVLLEKPIAATLQQAEALLALCRRHERVLHVGHLEWYNTAMRVIRSEIRAPRFVEVHRVGPFPSRALDVDVVRDLMIHDLDILQRVIGEEPDSIEAMGLPVISETIDIANARIGFPSGCIANLTASRVAALPARKMRFFQRDGCLAVDFLAQKASIYRRSETANGPEPPVEVEELRFDPEDALLAQLRAFVDAVRTRDVASSAYSAVGALRTALRVVEAMPPSRLATSARGS